MNQLWEIAIKNRSDAKCHILQSDKILRNRPDGHSGPWTGDCLHYCLPGPLDTLSFQLAMLMLDLHDVHKIKYLDNSPSKILGSPSNWLSSIKKLLTGLH
jgi:hypothetical protein